MNSYKGKILASTHNPIISIIPKIKNYFYTQRDDNLTYKVFFSTNYLKGKMIGLYNCQKDEKKDTKEMLLNIIEGSKKAFEERGKKYEEIK